MNWTDKKQAIIARMKEGCLNMSERRVFDAVSGAANISLLEVMRVAAVSYNMARRSLVMLRAAGLVEQNGRVGAHSRWHLAGLKLADQAPLSKLYPQQRAVFDLVASSPIGYSLQELSAALGRSSHTVTGHLCILKSLGLVVNTAAHLGGTRYARWTVPSALEAAIDHADKSVKRPRKKRDKPQQYVSRGAALGDSPTVRIVDAAKAKPIRPTGPVSVFHMGAM